jgi:penicillin amidase
MPSALNPQEGYIVNCNNRPVGDDYPHRISNSWSAPYRHDRVLSLLGSTNEPSIEQFRGMQMDVYSMQAEALLPKVLAYTYTDGLAIEAAAMLKGWDRQVRADSAGAAVWEVFLCEFVRSLLGDELGDDLFYYYNILLSRYLVLDVILDRPESGLWDRKDTPRKEGPQEILSMALHAAMQTLEKRLGSSRGNWSWGRLHTIVWKHAGATSQLTSMLLNVGPFPLGGDAVTLNAESPNLARGEYRSVHIPAVRMIASLADLDRLEIMVPLGQSGQPGHEHYDDMVKPWLEGRLFNLPVSEANVKPGIVSTLTLSP